MGEVDGVIHYQTSFLIVYCVGPINRRQSSARSKVVNLWTKEPERV